MCDQLVVLETLFVRGTNLTRLEEPIFKRPRFQDPRTTIFVWGSLPVARRKVVATSGSSPLMLVKVSKLCGFVRQLVGLAVTTSLGVCKNTSAAGHIIDPLRHLHTVQDRCLPITWNPDFDEGSGLRPQGKSLAASETAGLRPLLFEDLKLLGDQTCPSLCPLEPVHSGKKALEDTRPTFRQELGH